MNDETYAPVAFPSQGNPISRFYRFTALDGTRLIELVQLVIAHSKSTAPFSHHRINIADTRQRGTESVTSSSRAAAELGANDIISQRDGPFCVFTLLGPAEKAHIIPHRVQSKVCASTDARCQLLTSQ